MNTPIHIEAGKPIGDLPIGTEFTYGSKRPMRVELDHKGNCLECGFYDSDTFSESNCQLLEVEIPVSCGGTTRADKQPVYYPFINK